MNGHKRKLEHWHIFLGIRFALMNCHGTGTPHKTGKSSTLAIL
jgi:hypothetical protein